MNDLQRELTEQIKRYRLERIEPNLERDESEGIFRKQIFNGLGELGLCGMTLPANYGGAELGVLDLCYCLQELAKSSVSYAITLSVSMMVQHIINDQGSEEQKKKYLPPLTSGKEIGAFALTEPGAGSDARSLRTTAKKVKEGYLLNGAKMFITSAGEASTYIVMAKTDEGEISAFIVEDKFKGLKVGKKERKMGWKVSPTCELNFENCLVPKENLIKGEGEGLKVALSALDKGRITIGAIAVGLSQRALDEAVSYSLGRQQFGQAVFDFQGLQFMMADMATEVSASELLVHRAAALYDDQQPSQMISSMAKLKSTDTAMKVTTDAVQILGGVGYTQEYPVERLMRDAKVLQIVEGTNQIQRVVIARNLKKIYS